MISTVTTHRKILFFIPFGFVALTLLISWVVILVMSMSPFLTQYLGLLSFAFIVFSLFRDKTYKKTIVFLGIYLILATFNLLSFQAVLVRRTWGIRIGSLNISTPEINGYSLFLLILYIALNFDTLTDIYLDYKEIKGKL